MRIIGKFSFFAAVIVLPGFFSGGSSIGAEEIALDETISQAGTVSFTLKTDRRYFNGVGQANYAQALVTLPGISEIAFRRTDSVVNLRWVWMERGGSPKFHDVVVDFFDLPGPESYFLLFTWDSVRGISEAYINGVPLRIPGCRFDPWEVKQSAGKVITDEEGRLEVLGLTVRGSYTPPASARAAVPEAFRGRHEALIGNPKPAQPSVDIRQRRGKLLYESSLATEQSVKDWVAEGPLATQFEDQSMFMRSREDAGHFVFWCPHDFPDRFIAEWDFEVRSRYGLAIVFFAAKGEEGQDIFSPSMPKRDGSFRDYTRGKMTSYHISYFANVENFQMGRTDSNLRKNNQFYRVGGGPVAVKPGAKGWQRIRLVKDGNRIQLYNNDVLYLDWTDDDPQRYGAPHQDGKIGLRQMKTTVGRYRNFKVWELEPES